MKGQHIGFTGSRDPISPRQHRTLRKLIKKLVTPLDTLHHGDCIGADAIASDAAYLQGAHITVHPPTNGAYRAYVKCHTTLEPQPYLRRNRSIVTHSDLLIACPRSHQELLRSGTWATIRYARKKGIPLHIIYPDGTIGD